MPEHLDKQHKSLETWLNDAYAMEEGLVKSLESQLKQLKDMPDARAKVEQHLEVTKNQAERVKDCIQRMGGTVHHGKSAIADIVGAIQGMSTSAAADKELKITLADAAIEHFEINSYRSLAAAARNLGHEDIAQTCEGIMRQEEEMATWVEKQIATVTERVLRGEV